MNQSNSSLITVSTSGAESVSAASVNISIIHAPPASAARTEAAEIRELRFTNTLPLIRKIATHRLRGQYNARVEDLVQTVALKLWSWHLRRGGGSEDPRADETAEGNAEELPISGALLNSQTENLPPGTDQSAHPPDIRHPKLPSPAVQISVTESELSQEGWLKIAARASVNEVNSFYNSKVVRRELLYGAPENLPLPELLPYYGVCRLEGESPAETASLLKYFWREMQTLSLRERACFLLSKDEFVDDLLGQGVCSITDLAGYLRLERAQFMIILEKLPLADEAIRELITEQTGKPVTLRQIWTARSKARAKLARKLREHP